MKRISLEFKSSELSGRHPDQSYSYAICETCMTPDLVCEANKLGEMIDKCLKALGYEPHEVALIASGLINCALWNIEPSDMSKLLNTLNAAAFNLVKDFNNPPPQTKENQ